MKVRPILFSGPMVRALLAGTKTQTRRLLKLPDAKAESKRGPWEVSTIGGPGVTTRDGKPFSERACLWHPKAGTVVTPRWSVGDLLWVKETWRTADSFDDLSPSQIGAKAVEAGYLRPWCPLAFEAGGAKSNFRESAMGGPGKIRQSIFMPRWTSRISLEVKQVRIEQLDSISEADALAEGCKVIRDHCYVFEGTGYDTAKLCHGQPSTAYACLWNELHDKDGERWSDNPWIVPITFTVHQVNVDRLLDERRAA